MRGRKAGGETCTTHGQIGTPPRHNMRDLIQCLDGLTAFVNVLSAGRLFVAETLIDTCDLRPSDNFSVTL
jgi:hypothetical protein